MAKKSSSDNNANQRRRKGIAIAVRQKDHLRFLLYICGRYS